LYEFRGKWHQEEASMAKQARAAAAASFPGAWRGPGGLVADPAPRLAPDALGDLAASYSEEEIFDLVVPKRTLARRHAKKEPLTVEESDRALRLARIADLAARVFGDVEKAGRWLRKPKRALGGTTPLAFLASEIGARQVEEMLVRIDQGMAA
jgi:putative toxin-antitoxin system antitoxin component (TIGR02293 family)